MSVLYLDCSMGAAGDMISAALLELIPDKAEFVHRLNHLGIPGIEFAYEPAVRAGITGTRMIVKVHGEEEGHHHHHHHDHDHDHGHDHEHSHDHGHGHHHHSGLADIEHIISHLDIPDYIKNDIVGVYKLIAEAESVAHGVPVTEIHFHEVGTMDAVADVTAATLMLYEINPERICATSVRTGYGSVKCAHGILPVPAPATAYILKGVPVYSGEIEGEMCTPTGAALLKYFVDEFNGIPAMVPEKIGYGMGTKEFETANCVRAILGNPAQNMSSVGSKFVPKEAGDTDAILQLSCNVDDMTGEEVGYAMDRLFEAGAREVFTLPCGMKKSRPGILINVLCDKKDREVMLETLFRHTTTIGVREQDIRRNVLERKIETLDTPFGPIRKKISTGFGVTRAKYEYDDLAKAAKEHGVSIREVEDTCRDYDWE